MADEAKLIAVVEARTVQFERALKKIESQTDKTFRRTETSARRMDSSFRRSAGNVVFLDRSMQSLGRSMAGVGRTLIAGTAISGVLSLTGAINKARDAVRQFDAISDQAAATGLDTDFFQGIVFGAKEAGVNQDRLNDALVTFSKNAGLAAEGKGRMVSQLKALNPALLQALQNAGSTADRLRILADALATETDASRRAAIGAATLGDAWDELLPVFAKGAQGLDNLVARAREMGVIVPPEMLRNAGELEDKLNTLSFVIDQNLNQALVTLAPQLVLASEAAASLAKSFKEIIGPAQQVVEALNQTRAGAAALATAIDPVGFWKAMAAGMSLFGDEAQESIERMPRLQAEIAEIEARIATMKEGFGEGIFTEQAIAGDVARLRVLKEEIAAIEQGIRDAKDADLAPRPIPVAPQPLPPAVIIDEEAAKELERQREAVVELISDLQFELEQLGRNAEEQAVANALREAGAVATQEQRTEIERLVRTIEQEEAAQKALADAQEEAAKRAEDAAEEAQRQAIERIDALRTATGGLLSAFNDELFRTGSLMDALRAAAQELQRILLRIAEQALISALFGPQGTAPGGILGGLLGGGGVGTAAPRITLPVTVQPVPATATAAPAITSRTLLPPVIENTIPTLQSFGRSVQAASQNLLEFAPAVDGTTTRFGSLLDLIRQSEVGPTGGFNTTLGFGRFGGAGANLTGMTLDQIDALQTQILNNPANTFGASPVGAFQITRTTLRGLRDQLGLTGQELFTPELQTQLAEQLIQNRLAEAQRLGVSPVMSLRNEWEGLQNVDAGAIQAALDQAAGDITSSTQELSTGLSTAASSVTQAAGTFTPQLTSGLSSITSAVTSSAASFGPSFQQALQSVIASIPAGSAGAGQGLQLAGFLSSIGYGGLFQHGGRLGAGKWGIAGEHGPEIIMGPANIVPPRLIPPHERQRERRGDVHVSNTFVVPSIDNPRSQNQMASKSAASVQRAVRIM